MFDTRGMEQLHSYIAANPPKTDREWSAFLGISRSHFTMIRNGTALPSRKLAAKIERLTGIPRTAWDTADGRPPKAKVAA